MFGYVTPNKPELRVKDMTLYRAYYCGLCKTLRRKFGITSKFLLNYDCTFSALMLAGINTNNDGNCCQLGRCEFKPIAKKYPIAKSSSELDFSAALNVLLAYYKFQDDWDDEKKIKAGNALIIFKRAAKLAKKLYPSLDTAIRDGLSSLDKLEKNRCSEVDLPANAFGDLLANAICSAPNISSHTLEILHVLCYNVGKWIYFIDAWCDREKDIADNSYNPFVICNMDDKRAEALLVLSLNEACKAYDLLNVESNKALLDNIMYDGCFLVTEMQLRKKTFNNDGGKE